MAIFQNIIKYFGFLPSFTICILHALPTHNVSTLIAGSSLAIYAIGKPSSVGFLFPILAYRNDPLIFPNFIARLSLCPNCHALLGNDETSITMGRLFIAPFYKVTIKSYLLRNQLELFLEPGFNIFYGYLKERNVSLSSSNFKGMSIGFSTVLATKFPSSKGKMGIELFTSIGYNLLGTLTKRYRTYVELGLGIQFVLKQVHTVCNAGKY